MIGRIVLALIAFAAIMAVFQMLLVALVITGLIFRPRETLGVMLLLGLISLIGNHPLIGTGVVAFIIFGAVMHAKRKSVTADDTLLPPASVDAD